MSLLFRIVYAAHANGTHHKLALDALRRLGSPDAENWRRLFLKHAELYLTGSKDPDKSFKDFRNHVLHVEDNYWGGAPEKADQWYGRLVDALKGKSWQEAVYCAGVLSHYYTDPIHPFHTAQSEQESNIHRAVEWSISRAYDGLRKDGEAKHGNLALLVPRGSTWLKDFVIAGAEKSNQSYTALIAHYNFDLGVADPPAGLTPRCRTIIAELLIYAAEGFARILDRAFVEAKVTPPDVALTAETFMATLKIPAKWVEKKLTNAEDRDAVRAMYDELNQTGRVDKTLSEDDRTIRDLHAEEVLKPRAADRAKQRTARLEAAASGPHTELASMHSAKPDTAPPPARADGDGTQPTNAVTPMAAVSTPAHADELVVTAPDITSAEANLTPAGDAADICDDQQADTEIVTSLTSRQEPRNLRPLKFYLELHDDLVDAPSIGPKTAQRFYDIGISTVADFLDEDAAAMAELLDTSFLTTETLTAWQTQAHLVITVPGLRGTHAQLLQGAGFLDVDSLASADPAELSAAVLSFATTTDGKRILRDGAAPDLEKIKSWIDNAQTALAA